MFDKTIKAWGAGLAWQMAIAVGLWVLSLLVLVCVSFAALVMPLPDDDLRALVVGGGLAGFFIIGIGGALAWGFWTISRRAHRLDEIFKPLGLSGSGYLTNGRQYHGSYFGRQLHVYFYRGPALDIYLGTSLCTRMGIGERNMIASAAGSILNSQPMLVNDPAFARLEVYPLDENWADQLLRDSAAREIITQLTTTEGSLEYRSLILQPEALLYKLYRTQEDFITPQSVQRWLNYILALLKIAESLPAPTKTAEPNRLERTSRMNRNAYTLPAIGITCGLLGGLTVCFLAAALIVLYATGSY